MKYIGLDFGSKTIGIAISQGIITSKYRTLRFEENNYEKGINLLINELNKLNPETIIVGWPKNMDGSEGHRVEMVKQYLDILENKFKINSENIIKVDERLTTRFAKSIMIQADLSRKKQKENKDNLAAQLILETFLNQINNKTKE